MITMRGPWCDNPHDAFDDAEIEAMQFAGRCHGKGGGGTNTIKQDIPAWLQDAGKDNYQNAVNISQRPYQQSPNTVVGYNQANLDVFNRVGQLQGSTDAGYNAALGVTGQVAGYNPQQVQTQYGMQSVNGGQVAGNGQAIAGAMNPYLDQVESYGLQALDQQRRVALNSNADSAFQAGGFGGSRAAVQDASTNAQAAMQAGTLSANLRSQAYDNATNLLSSDAARNLAAQQSNQSTYANTQQMSLAAQQSNQQAGLSGAGLRLQAGQQIGNLTGQKLDATGKEIGLLDNVAGQQAAHDQALLDQNANWFSEAYNYPIAMQNLRQSALGLAPYSTTQSSTTTGNNGSIVGRAAGGAALGGSIAGALGASSGWGALAGGVLGAASDPELKENVRREGTDEQTGLGIFSWDYRGDPESAPRRLGLMAKGPGSVKEVMPEAYMEAGGVGGILTDKLPAHLRSPTGAVAPKLPGKGVRRKAGR